MSFRTLRTTATLLLGLGVLLSVSALPYADAQPTPGGADPLKLQVQVAGYFLDLFAKLKAHWQWHGDPKASARVDFTVDKDGTVKDVKFERSSNNPQFDGAVRRMLKEAQPLPIPPFPSLSRVGVDWPQKNSPEATKSK